MGTCGTKTITAAIIRQREAAINGRWFGLGETAGRKDIAAALRRLATMAATAGFPGMAASLRRSAAVAATPQFAQVGRGW